MTRQVAVIGYSFRFPSTSTKQYWQDLLDGRDLVTEVDADRWSHEAYLHPDKNHPGTSYTFAAGSLGDISTFDAGFFGISPRETALMDPQQRLLLEMSWEALENAGIQPSTIRGSQCGVYIGISSSDYSFRVADDLATLDSSAATGNTSSIAANRISYIFDLHGPSMAIDTACSSSLVAFHQACRSILSGETTQAFAGGISLHLHPFGFVTFSKATMLSKRGRCNVFDESGDGYVRSEGGGVFFLKDYDQAVADGNQILAVVANSAVNTDGRKSGLTVPNPKAQASLLEQTYAQAGIDPSAIDYIEAHGTGTAVGDPIETKAIGEALGKHRARNNPLLIGSVKSNLGHLETASGVAGLVKALHCIKHRVVPPTIGIKKPNPNILFDDWNLKVVTECKPLKKTGKLIVGINSFGFGGANAHVILESHERDEACPPQALEPVPLPLRLYAKEAAALKAVAQEFSAFLQEQPQLSLYDIAYNASFRREHHQHCAMVYGATAQAMADALLSFANDTGGQTAVETGIALKAPSGPAFIYSGNGSQWEGMGKQLLEQVPLFREAIREIDAIFRRHADYSLEDELAGKNGAGRYEHTEIAQPALFALQVGITQMLRQRGIMPVAVAGHSVGEVAAAWACGALTLEAAVEVIYHRSQLQGTTKGIGKMTAVGLGQEAAQSLLAELGLTSSLELAGINSSRGVTVAGSAEFLARLESALAQRNVFYKRLDLDYSFHSPAMDGIEAEVRRTLSSVRPHKSAVPFYSTVSGDLMDGQGLDAEYWWHNIRHPVLFMPAIKSIQRSGINIFVEIGPHAVLRSYINDCLKDNDSEGRIIPTVARGDDAPQKVWAAASQTIIAGAGIDWQHLFPSPGQFIQLPNYPWQRERHWHPVTSEAVGLLYRHKVHPLLGYPLRQHELTWENQLDTQLNPSLADHVVGEAIVFPGTGFSELALAAALAWHSGDLAEIEELEIRAPLILSSEHAMLVRLNIEAQDGSFAIRAREYGGADPWTVHAAGRILPEPRDIMLQQEAPALPTRQPDFTSASHEALTRRVGLLYGPAFQCIDHGWMEGNSALAILKTPATIAAELEETHLHPAMLDCTFQLIIHLLKDQLGLREGLAFIPTKMGRIIFSKSPSRPHIARATLLSRSPHSLTAEFTIFDAAGAVIATVKEARFRSISLSRNAADRLRFLDYHGTPKPHPYSAADGRQTITFDSVHATIAELSRRAALQGTNRRYSEEVDPLLDSLCSQFTRQALHLLSADGKKISGREVLDIQAATPEIEPFLAHLLSLSEDDQSTVKIQDGWNLQSDLEDQASAQDIWNSLVADYPDYFQIVHSVGSIGMHLHSLLRGEKAQPHICPQESSLAALMRLALGAAGKQKVGLALRDLIALGRRNLPEGQRLGIIEISEGLPSFAMDACVAMDFNCCDYTFASTSAATLDEANRFKELCPGIETRLIDAAATQPAAAACQIAILSLDFSSRDEAVKALTYAQNHLAPGCSLLVIGQHPSRWIDFVFGAQRQHWTQAADGTWLSSQQSSLFWQEQLQQRGFARAELFDLSPGSLSGAYLLVAQAAECATLTAPSANHTPRSFILLADQSGYSAQLSDQLTRELQAKGDVVIQACAGDTAHIESLLLDTTASYGQLDGIMHLAGLAPLPEQAAAEAILEQQLARCSTAASIIQACEATLTNTTCWLVTCGAASDLLPQPRPVATTRSAIPAPDAALWGFGRTLINEASNYTIRLVDLEDPSVRETVATALARELAQADNEQEIILTRGGARYAPRLGIEPASLTEVQRASRTTTVHLGFELPGQLRNLRWEAHPNSPPDNDEIEVEVHATGLNFRDVMYALGLLSDEAVENGFAGATLGLEFAGIVQSVGSKTSGFAIGDKVVGFGSASFANRLVTKTSAISHIPPGITFEAAATIPSTFFTVYYALHHLAQLQPGEKVLIHGAAGGVGIAAIQVAKWIGAEIYVTAGSDEKRDFLRLLGVDHIFDSRSLDFADEILLQTKGLGVDVVLNSLAGEAINRNFRVLKPFGRFLELGKRDFYENTKIGLRPFRNNISYFGIDADQLMQARPDLTRRLFAELMTLFIEGVLHPLPYHAFEAEDIVNAFRYMQQARQIGKIVITYRNGINHIHTPATSARKHLQLPADASYLITGGLGGFGLRTAEWLAGKGARNLVLISRSGPASDEARDAISRLQKQGVRVHAASCDITDRNALAQLLSGIAKTLPPLRGIVHAATVINDGLVRSMDAAQIRSVLAPKVLGAQFLHEMTLDAPLDFYVLFSSATTLFGNPGQGNYVAANASLEALAKHRRAHGLPATCVRWGAIDDVGFLARNEKIKDALQNRMGGSALNSAIALDALEDMLIADRSNVGVLELDWKAMARFLPSAGSPKFSELARNNHDNESDEDNAEDIQRLLLELSHDELLSRFTEILRSEIGEILRVSPDKIEPSRSLFDMGLDSLMGVELVVALESRFGIRLPVMALSQSPTIEKLAERIIQQLKGKDDDKEAASELLAQTQQVFAQHGVDASAESVASLTADISARQTTSNDRIIQ